jgi:hypothetical protein
MKIIVCGDSFCAATTYAVKDVGDRKHFSQILEDAHGHEVINLAHGGMSNVGIWFQIREAILLKPDVIVYNQTWSSRIELMMNKQYFNLENGLKNFIYFDPSATSTGTEYVGDVKHSEVLSTVWQGLKDNPFVDISNEQILAVDLYLKHMYHDGISTEIDTWMFEYWQIKIEQAGILGLKFNNEEIGKAAYDYSASNQIDCPYHTDAVTQYTVAHNIHQQTLKNLTTVK